MFKRLQNNFNLDFLDNKIAEEQEKQKQSQPGQKAGGSSPAKRAAAGTRRASNRTDSPNTRGSSSRLRVPEQRDASPQVKGPDPDDFVIGDDESGASTTTISRTGTPQPQPGKEGDDGGEGKEGTTDEGKKDTVSKEKDKATAPANDGNEELPEHVRRKLAQLEKLTAKYQGVYALSTTHIIATAAASPFIVLLTCIHLHRLVAQLSYRPRSCIHYRSFRSHPPRTHSSHFHRRPWRSCRVPQSAQLAE